jgi:hypothetical protein
MPYPISKFTSSLFITKFRLMLNLFTKSVDIQFIKPYMQSKRFCSPFKLVSQVDGALQHGSYSFRILFK